MFRLIYKPKWIFSTIIVILAMGIMVRLGVWQLDRLEKRRAFNTHYIEQLESPPVELNIKTINVDLKEMEYREITVTGRYDHDQQVAMRNQVWRSHIGVNLLTPLNISGTEQSIFVDRGWIPMEDYQSNNWQQFNEGGLVSIKGIIRLPQEGPIIGGRPDPTIQPDEFLKAWNFPNIEEISKQTPYPVLPVYIQLSPDSSRADLPYPSLPEIEISEGPHLSYAVQWFIFTAILGIGYPLFLRRESSKTKA
jgi:surfeit locus 1 family protein